jgi:hypothetical protein
MYSEPLSWRRATGNLPRNVQARPFAIRAHAWCRARLRRRQRPDRELVELFLEREGAEAMFREVRGDEPMLAEALRVEAIELGLR